MSEPREIKSHKIYRAGNYPSRSTLPLILGTIMFVAIVVAGVFLNAAGRDSASITGTLTAWTGIGLGVFGALYKLGSIEQTTAVVEKRTNGAFRATVRDEVRAALAEAFPEKIAATSTEVVDEH